MRVSENVGSISKSWRYFWWVSDLSFFLSVLSSGEIFFKSRTRILKLGSRRLAKSRNYHRHSIPLLKCGVADECKQYQKKIETTVDTDKSHNGTRHNRSMIVVTRIIVSATPRNEHRYKSANFSGSPGSEGYSKTFFLRWGSDPRPKPLYYRFIYHFRQKRCPFQVPLLTIMNKISWDSNAIFIIFCNFWVPRITVHSFRTFLTVPPPTLYKVKTRKKFWINAANVVRGVREGVGH